MRISILLGAFLSMFMCAPARAQQACVTHGYRVCITVPVGSSHIVPWREIGGNRQVINFAQSAGVIRFEVAIMYSPAESVEVFLKREYPAKLHAYAQGRPYKMTQGHGVVTAPHAGTFHLWQADYVFTLDGGSGFYFRQKSVLYQDLGGGYSLVVYAWNNDNHQPLGDHINILLASLTIQRPQVSIGVAGLDKKS